MSKTITPKEAFEAAKTIHPDMKYIERDCAFYFDAYFINGESSSFNWNKVKIDWGDLDRYPPKEKRKRYLTIDDFPVCFAIREKTWPKKTRTMLIDVDYLNGKGYGFSFYTGSEGCECYVTLFLSDRPNLERYQWSSVDKLEWKEFYIEEDV